MLNKIMLIGNLGRDPELNVTAEGTPITKFSLAVNRKYKTQTGQTREETEWFQIVVWRSLAELCERYLHKGSKVYVEGRLTQRKYTGKESVQRTAVEVQASDVQFLDSKHAVPSDQEIRDDRDNPFLPEQ
jgi:single-strand DNA-binding protein